MNHVKYFALILSSFVLLSACSHSPTEVDSQLDSLASNAGHSLTVDVAAVRSAEAVPPVGLWLNAVKDNLDSEPALQDLGVKALRWSPLDAYFDNSNAPKFKVGIEDPNNSLNFVVDEDGYRQHDLNFDDFMSVANSIGAKPIIDVYIHSAIYEGSLPHGDWDTIVQAAADLVEYANITQGYGVKRWEIGNEVDLNGWNVEDYARMVKDMSTAMKAVDPTIEVGVNGMTGEGWWDELLPKVGEYADYLISHQYSWYTDYTQWSTNVFTVGGNIGHVVDARDKYTPDLPIIITEISSLNPDQSEEANSVWRALHNIEVQAMGYYKGSDQNYAWGSRWFGDENVGMTRVFNADYQPLPLGTSIKFMNSVLGGKMLDYTPEVAAGVRSWSFYDDVSGVLTVLLLNKGLESQNANVTLEGYSGSLDNQRTILSGTDPEATEISISKAEPVAATANGFRVSLPKLSVTAVQFGK